MIEGKTILAIIPARGGSKGITRKNLRMLAGKPLIAWTIEVAKKSKYIDRLILSSEDEEILGIGRKWGCESPFIRPKELAQDDTPGIDVVIHSIDALQKKYDYVVLLQPTSPLRTVEDIDRCIEICIYRNVPACVSVTKPEKHPYWMYTLDEFGKLQKFCGQNKQTTRRQELPQVYALNGAVYVAKTSWVKKEKTFLTSKTLGFIMPQERSIDVDSIYEMNISEYLLLKMQYIANAVR